MRDEPFSATRVTLGPPVNINHGRICNGTACAPPSRRFPERQIRRVQPSSCPPTAGSRHGAGQAEPQALMRGPQTRGLASAPGPGPQPGPGNQVAVHLDCVSYSLHLNFCIIYTLHFVFDENYRTMTALIQIAQH